MFPKNQLAVTFPSTNKSFAICKSVPLKYQGSPLKSIFPIPSAPDKKEIFISYPEKSPVTFITPVIFKSVNKAPEPINKSAVKFPSTIVLLFK